MYNMSQVIDLDHQSFFIQWMVLFQLKTSPNGVLAGLRHAGRAVTKTVAGNIYLSVVPCLCFKKVKKGYSSDSKFDC